MADHAKETGEFGSNDDFWLFGYGSLLWKPPPHFDQRVPGYIQGYVRRFWQCNGEDHRGTPDAPGRVVTLIDRAHWETLTDHHAAADVVWGAAYHIPTAHVASVREYLDIREVNGYSIQFTPFYPAARTTSTATSSLPPEHGHGDAPLGIRKTSTTEITHDLGSPINCLVYIGLPENPQFLGPQDPHALAMRILQSKGPSGENKDYLFMLEHALKALSRESGDAHVSDLARTCRQMEGGEARSENESGLADMEEVEN
ncbi:hypothetical protein ACEQ8H_008482 [Pleosporales sp. CAS-2024a]